MSWAPELSTEPGSFGRNSQRFATKEEAEIMAKDIFHRWLAAIEWRATESEDPVNYAIVDGALKNVPEIADAP